jgi:RNA polymerase sigma factor (sigma-70 family)
MPSNLKHTVGGERFEDVVLPHLDAGYRLARWLVRNETDAEDVVQEAALRAFRYFHTFGGGDSRAWFLRIVRNACRDPKGYFFQAITDPFDEEQHNSDLPAFNPEALLQQVDDVALIQRALRNIQPRFRELLVLRELEGLTYREIADVIGMPIGTVMSGLSRARQAFRRVLEYELNGETPRRGHHIHEHEAVEVMA